MKSEQLLVKPSGNSQLLPCIIPVVFMRSPLPSVPVSSEFVSLCQAQISLVASLGASLSVVYLAEDWVEGGNRKLIPVASYPETAEVAWENLALAPASSKIQPITDQLLLQGETTPPKTSLTDSTTVVESDNSIPWGWEARNTPNPGDFMESEPVWQTPPRRVVLPLVHEGVVMGFLVTGRTDRDWNPQEEHQIRAIAHTLTTACVLDRRANWFQAQLQHQHHLWAQEHDTLHTVLHQLKSPLTALKTFGKLLMKRLLPQDRNYSVAEGIVRESDRLKELLQYVDQTLTLAETQPKLTMFSPDMPLLPETTFPGECPVQAITVETILESLIASAQVIADERQLTLSTLIPQPLPQVQADAKALREVISNILDNALKYTPTGGRIHLQVRGEIPKASFSKDILGLGIAISDSGLGIPAEDLDHLFQRGYRGAQAKGNIPGTGLGLAITQDLIQQMDGDIW
ncbi:MAG: sensor histidine kinase, partial [Microcoleaceae cyanobacterium]